MSEVGADGVADDGRLGLGPTDAVSEAVGLRAQEGPRRQPDVVALRLRGSRAAALHPGALLYAPAVALDRPAALRALRPSQVRHRQPAGGPVRNVAVWGG